MRNRKRSQAVIAPGVSLNKHTDPDVVELFNPDGTPWVASSEGSESSPNTFIDYARRFNGNIPLTHANWASAPEDSYVFAAAQTATEDRGIYITDGTETLAPIVISGVGFILSVSEIFDTFADFPATSTQGTTMVIPKNWDFATNSVSDDFSVTTFASLIRYTPSVGANFDGSVTQVGEALEELAARVRALEP